MPAPQDLGQGLFQAGGVALAGPKTAPAATAGTPGQVSGGKALAGLGRPVAGRPVAGNGQAAGIPGQVDPALMVAAGLSFAEVLDAAQEPPAEQALTTLLTASSTAPTASSIEAVGASNVARGPVTTNGQVGARPTTPQAPWQAPLSPVASAAPAGQEPVPLELQEQQAAATSEGQAIAATAVAVNESTPAFVAAAQSQAAASDPEGPALPAGFQPVSPRPMNTTVEAGFERAANATPVSVDSRPTSAEPVGPVEPAAQASAQEAFGSMAPTSQAVGRREGGSESDSQIVELAPVSDAPVRSFQDVAPTAATDTQPTEPSAAAVVGQVADGLRFSARQGGREIVVRMDPPELGEVRVALRSVGDGVHGVVTAGRPETLAQLEREAPMLLARLAETGVQVHRIEMNLAEGARQDTSSGQQGPGSDSPGHQGAAMDWDREHQAAAQPAATADAAGVDDEPDGEAATAPATVGGGLVNVWI